MPRQGFPETTRELLEEIAGQYNAGSSMRQIAAAKGWSFGATQSRLHMAAVAGLTTVRGRGRGRRVNDR